MTVEHDRTSVPAAEGSDRVHGCSLARNTAHIFFESLQALQLLRNYRARIRLKYIGCKYSVAEIFE